MESQTFTPLEKWVASEYLVPNSEQTEFKALPIPVVQFDDSYSEIKESISFQESQYQSI